MKILFVMDRRVNAGTIQAVAGYARAGDTLGHTVAVYGAPGPGFPGVRFASDPGAFDRVVFLFESDLRWLSGLRLAHLLSRVPRRRRAILDADGMYNGRVCVDDYDRNHATEADRSAWLAYYERLADKVLQPTPAPGEPGVVALPFYGYDPANEVPGGEARPKRFDVLHIGHNWWRWREVSTVLLPALEQIRAELDGVCFTGLWWDAPPPWAAAIGLGEAIRVDPDRLQRLAVQVRPPTPYTEVIALMSQARVNLMTQRPLFRRLQIVTSKYFEVFCADTIPLVLLDPDHAERVYGPAGRELALHERVGERLLDALRRPEKYREAVHEVRRHLAAHHSYECRLRELVAALEG